MRSTRLFTHCLAPIIATLLGAGSSVAGTVEVFISVPDQSLAVLRDGELLGKFRVSTSKFGLGDNRGSYKTPLGEFRVCDKVGGGLPLGSVLSGRHATGEVLPPNARGRDPIVTRILWLDGLEAGNSHARSRGIYIHGTAEEKKVGHPVSYGCIRMRSADVTKLYDLTPVGSTVRIETRKLSAMTKPRIEERDNRIAAEREAAKAAELAMEKMEREAKLAEKALAKNSLPAVASNSAGTSKHDDSADLESGKSSSLSRAAAKFMKGSILDFDVYERADTIPARGGEVRLPTNMATLIGPPVEKKLTVAHRR